MAKEWHRAEGSDSSVLIEAVLWEQIAPELATLPEVAVNGSPSEPKDRMLCLKEVTPPKSGPKSSGPVELASAQYQPAGVAWDLITVNASGGYTFSSGNTYHVQYGYFGQTVTFQSQCVLKFGGDLIVYGPIVCNGSCSSPSVLTSADDSQDGSGCPATTSNNGLWIYYINNNISIGGFLDRFVPIRLDANGCATYTYTVHDTRFERGGAILANNCIIHIEDCSGVGDLPNSQCTYATGDLSDNCGEVSLQDSVISATAALAAAHDAPVSTTDMRDAKLYTDTGSPNYYVTGYNTDCWIYGIYGYTSLSMSNTSSVGDWYQGGGTLITPRFAVTADHMGATSGTGPNGGFVGREFRWIGTDGQHYVRTCIGQTFVSLNGENSDMCVLMLSSTLPSAVQPVKLVSSAVNTKMPSLTDCLVPGWDCRQATAPCITTHGNLPKTSYAYDWRCEDLYLARYALADFVEDMWLPGAWGASEPFGGHQSLGDSGQPAWALINNELVLVGTFTWSNAEGWYGYDPSKVNAAIAFLSEEAQPQLQPPYEQVTVVDLTGFPDH